MVYAFMICSMNGQSCELLFSQEYHHEVISNQDSEIRDGGEVEQSVSGTSQSALEIVSKKLLREYNFSSSIIKHRGNTKEKMQLTEITPELITGLFTVSKNKPPYFSQEKFVIWCGAMGLVFALIIGTNENRGLASIILKYITKFVHDYLQAFYQPKEIALKPHVVIQIVNKFLPCGQLMFMNHKVVKHLEKELSQLISSLPVAK